MEPLIVDSNVIVASFLDTEARHDIARQYINGLENGDYVFHLPMLVPVEAISAIWRHTQGQGMALVTRARMSLEDWEAAGGLILYPLNRERMELGMDAAIKYRLSGADSIVSSLADELDMPFVTFDSTLQRRVPRASP